MSEATIRNRYARLCRGNVLQVTGVTNPLGLGFDAQAMIGIKTNGPVEMVADEVATWREASYVVVAAGQYDVLVELVCTDRHHLLEIINRIRGSTPSCPPRASCTWSFGSSSTTGARSPTGLKRTTSRRNANGGPDERRHPLVSEMPHGGFRQSGYGKDMSMYSVEEYTVVKRVMAKID